MVAITRYDNQTQQVRLLIRRNDIYRDDIIETICDEYLQAFTDDARMLSSLNDEGVSPGNAFVRELGVVLYSAVAKHPAENRERFLASVRYGEES